MYLVRDVGLGKFINADHIAAGLSPLKPERAALAAGRILLLELERLISGERFLTFSEEGTQQEGT